MVIISNPTLANQRESSQWLRTGFLAHGIDAEITADRHKEADVHVIQGNWYAYSEWLGKDNVLFLSRGFYGDERFDISLGWLRPDGSRDFKNHGMAVTKGILPKLRPRKDARRCAVVFGDYGRDAAPQVDEARARFSSLFYKPHPRDEQVTQVMTLRCGLDEIWDFADVAIGHSSTVLVKAAINGLHVESTDPLHVVQGNEDREAWLMRMSWAMWNYKELESGAFWDHLC